jgi:peptidoglycan/LPS O-acetylase OafA/YrhL
VARSQRISDRVGWVDGIRGAAAMFVVLHHIWLGVWPGYPRNTGPWWVGWMLYGQLAVAVFIVVSGFSLALAPLRRGATLSGGTRRFLRRRAWRILPPYWAALVFSTIIVGYIVHPGLHTIARGFVVHALLLQDITGSWVVNGAFWSIAIEWQIYFLFPLILLLARRRGIVTTVACTVLLVLAARALSHLGSPFTKIDHLTPQLLALFALGILAVDLGQTESAARLQRALIVIGSIAIAAVVILAVVKGSVWMVSQYFTIDIVFGFGVACLMAVMYGGGLPRVRRVLASRFGLRFGLLSFSIYLLHGPILGLFEHEILSPMHPGPLATFALLLVVGIPVILVICYGFHLMFEAPFLVHRDTGAIRAMPIFRAARRLRRRLGFGPVSPAPEVAAPLESGPLNASRGAF